VNTNKAVAIVSGGLDSTVLAYWMATAYTGRSRNSSDKAWQQLHIISFDYGQRHVKELEYARLTAATLGARFTLIDLKAGGVTGLLKGSALTDRAVEVPEGHYAAENMKATIVPNRNSIMLAIAYAAAVADGARAVGIAVHAGDHAIYPDCRPEFIEQFAYAEKLGNAWAEPSVAIGAPFINKTKAQIVMEGATLGVPFNSTWSCYKGMALHCGACGTCVERREAFKLAGIEDPTMYFAEPEFEAPKVKA
jgi:7-cyano-7-deazaguanine synthase